MNLANRDNKGKVQLSYILEFPESMRQISERMTLGAAKHDRHNWKKGMGTMSCLDSLMRHLSDFANGADMDHDDESLTNMSGVIVNAMFIIEHMYAGVSVDDRTKIIEDK